MLYCPKLLIILNSTLIDWLLFLSNLLFIPLIIYSQVQMFPTLSTEDPSSNGSSNRGLFFSYDKMWRGTGCCWHWFSDSAIPRSLIFWHFPYGNKMATAVQGNVSIFQTGKGQKEAEPSTSDPFLIKAKPPEILTPVSSVGQCIKWSPPSPRKVGKWKCKPFQAF